MFTHRQLLPALFVSAVALVVFPCAALADDNRPAPPATQPSADLTGNWTWSFEGFGGQIMEFTFKLKQDGQKLTGTMIGFNAEETDIHDGSVNKDGEFTFKVSRNFNGQQMTTTYSGKRLGDNLQGKTETVFSRSFDAKRSQP